MKEILTSPGRPYQHREQESKSKILALVDGEPESIKKPLSDVLKVLFPGIEWAFGGSERDTGFLALWLQERRISSPQIFDKFFQFGVLQNDISAEETGRVIALSGDREKLVSAFANLNGRGLLSLFAERLEVFKNKIPPEAAIPFVTAVFDIGDQLPEDQPGTFIGPSLHFRRVVYCYLLLLKSQTERMAILARAIRETTGLIQPMLLASDENSSRRREDGSDKSLVSDEDAQSLKAMCLQKVNDAALDGRLSKSIKLGPILYRWLEWEGPDEVRKWVSNVASSPAGALTILRALAGLSLLAPLFSDFPYPVGARV